jgi:hypothetical protein
MGDFAVLTFKIAFLVVLWLFIAVVALVIRTDMVGRRARPAASGAAASGSGSGTAARSGQAAPKPRHSGSTPPKRKRGLEEATILAIDSGSLAGQRFQLVDHVRIGRSAECELYLDDKYVSSRRPHAELVHQPDGTWLLTDLGSTNGTYVDGVRIAGPKVVTTADTIQIGRTQMRLEV